MIVSRGGKIFAKSFRREVYDAIGRTFTKRFIQKLNIVISIIVDAVVYLYHVKTWQKKYNHKMIECVGSWKGEVVKDILEEQLPSIEKANNEGIHSLYDDLIGLDVKMKDKQSRSRVESLSNARQCRARIRTLREKLAANEW
jgi:hypothetical protein